MHLWKGQWKHRFSRKYFIHTHTHTVWKGKCTNNSPPPPHDSSAHLCASEMTGVVGMCDKDEDTHKCMEFASNGKRLLFILALWRHRLSFPAITHNFHAFLDNFSVKKSSASLNSFPATLVELKWRWKTHTHWAVNQHGWLVENICTLTCSKQIHARIYAHTYTHA